MQDEARMTEPATLAREWDVVIPGVRHWSVNDDRIGFRSDAYAVESPSGIVLVDPLPLEAVPDEYQDAPRRTRDSVRALLDEPFEVVCGGHAPPVAHDGRHALRAALEADAASARGRA
jgi:hypothetical protein